MQENLEMINRQKVDSITNEEISNRACLNVCDADELYKLQCAQKNELNDEKYSIIF